MQSSRTSESVLGAIQSRREEIERRFAVRRMGVFGSAVRGDARDVGDVDVLVDMADPTFDRYMDLKFYLEELLGKKVDLVLEETIKPRLRSYIQNEIVHVQGFKTVS